MRRLLGTVCLLACMLLVFPASALQETVLPQEWTARISAEILEWMPLDEIRTKDMAALVRHISFEIAHRGADDALRVLVDGEEAFSVSVLGGEEEQAAWFSSCPGTVFLGTDLTEKLTGLDAASSGLPAVMEASQRVLEGLREWPREGGMFEEKADTQKVRGYGETTKRLTYTGSMDELVLRCGLSGSEIAAEDSPLLYYLTDDGGMPLKTAFSGKVACGGETWKVSAWAKSGADREETSMEATAKDDQGRTAAKRTWKSERNTSGPQAVFSYQWTEKNGKVTAAEKLSGEYAWEGDTLKGSAAYHRGARAAGRDGLYMEMTWELHRDDEGKLSGQVQLEWEQDKANPARLALDLSLTPSAAVPGMPDDAGRVDVRELSGEEIRSWTQNISNGFSRSLLAALMKVDEQDLAYLSRGLDGASWQTIRDAATQQ